MKKAVHKRKKLFDSKFRKDIKEAKGLNVFAPKLVRNKSIRTQKDGRLVRGFDVVVRSQEATIAK